MKSHAGTDSGILEKYETNEDIVLCIHDLAIIIVQVCTHIIMQNNLDIHSTTAHCDIDMYTITILYNEL